MKWKLHLKMTGSLQLYSTFMKFLLFSTIPLFVETVTSIRISIVVCLIVSFAADTLEGMRARLTFLCSKPWRVWLIVFFAAPCLLPVMFGVMRSIAFDTSGHMWLATECWVALFPTVLTLWNSGVHICTIDSSDVTTNIELSVDDCLSFGSILWIPDIDPNNSHIRFGRCFDYTRF